MFVIDTGLSLCRQAFDDVWSRFTKLGSPVGSDPSLLMDTPDEGRAPQASYTRVLVIGATGRCLCAS